MSLKSWIVAMVVSSSSGAAAQAPPPCPALFGDDQVREDNRERRERRALVIAEDDVANETMYDLIYQGDPWREPAKVSLRGVHLDAVRRTDAGPDGERVAEVSFENGSRSACGVRVDDEIAPGVPVLAILNDGLLIERDGALYFAARDGHDAPGFRLTWRSSYSIVYEEPTRPTPRKPVPMRGKRRR